ncbi:MAG: hypothetical protein E7647_03080 [Ruminococcaceae bacterium]|nr:hypothetical protein [Oscillospiraceae bacterium]
MKLTLGFIHNLTKILFSAVIFQLFCIALGADSGCFSPSTVTAMLEYPAAAAVCALGGGAFLEYILKNE